MGEEQGDKGESVEGGCWEVFPLPLIYHVLPAPVPGPGGPRFVG